MVPATAALREISSVARDHDVQDCEPSHCVWVLGGKREGDRPAPVVAGKEESLNPEMIPDQLPDIVCYCLLIIAARWARRVPKPPQIGRDYRIVLCQVWDNVTPFVRALRDPVQEHNWLSLSGS